jgi:hypothetical protein
MSTVFLNFLKSNVDEIIRNHPDPGFSYVLCQGIDEFLYEVLSEIAFGECYGRKPNEELYGKGSKTDPRFRNAMKSQLPEYAQDGHVLFPWGLESFLSLNDDHGTNSPFKVDEIADYLSFRIMQGDNIERMSVPDAIRLSNQWHNSKSFRLAKQEKEGIDFKIVMQFPDDYKVVRLLTPLALDNESFHCKHCVGKGTYDENVISGAMKIYSLRDPSGAPVATLEIANNKVNQIKGHKNGPVSDTVHNHVREFILAAGFSISRDHANIGISPLKNL